jgi:hypothetical protein
VEDWKRRESFIQKTDSTDIQQFTHFGPERADSHRHSQDDNPLPNFSFSFSPSSSLLVLVVSDPDIPLQLLCGYDLLIFLSYLASQSISVFGASKIASPVRASVEAPWPQAFVFLPNNVHYITVSTK